MNQQNKFCTNCGQQLKIGDNFCNKCGTPFNQQVITNNEQRYYVNNYNNTSDETYGILSLVIGIGTFFAPIFIYFWNYIISFNAFTYIILLVLEITGLMLGFACKSKTSSKKIGITLNIIAILMTTFFLFMIISIYGFIKIFGG